MLRSVAVDGRSPAATFLRALQSDLVRFGRQDTLLFDSGDATALVWNQDFATSASFDLRDQALAARLAGRQSALIAIEARLPPHHFQPFNVDFGRLTIDIVPCARHSMEEALFEYIAEAQSLAAETRTMRIGRFLVYNWIPGTARVMGAIALKSPMYFDGARDRHLGWPPLSTMVNGKRVKSQPAIELRNAALKSIFNISVCMAVAPYNRHGFSRLIAALAVSRPIVDYMEATYGDPMLGLTTTGTWGGTAAQYERIRLGLDRTQYRSGKLFERTHGVSRSFNYALAMFSRETFDAAFEMMHKSHRRSGHLRKYTEDDKLRQNLLHEACRHLRIPRRAIAANVISHYFGSVSRACRTALATVDGIAAPPARRSIEVTDIYRDWLNRTSIPPLAGVCALRLSERAT
jgi:hypothetical protein